MQLEMSFKLCCFKLTYLDVTAVYLEEFKYCKTPQYLKKWLLMLSNRYLKLALICDSFLWLFIHHFLIFPFFVCVLCCSPICLLFLLLLARLWVTAVSCLGAPDNARLPWAVRAPKSSPEEDWSVNSSWRLISRLTPKWGEWLVLYKNKEVCT